MGAVLRAPCHNFGMKITHIVAATVAIAISTAVAPAAHADPAGSFMDCLRDNGVSVPLPKPPKGAPPPSAGQVPPAPPGVDSVTWESAWNACFKYAPKPKANP